MGPGPCVLCVVLCGLAAGCFGFGELHLSLRCSGGPNKDVCCSLHCSPTSCVELEISEDSFVDVYLLSESSPDLAKFFSSHPEYLKMFFKKSGRDLIIFRTPCWDSLNTEFKCQC